MSNTFEATINETMSSVIPMTAGTMRAWVKKDMAESMAADTHRVRTWVSWIESGAWTLDQIAAMICDVATSGRADGVVMDRESFKSYCASLTLLSRQIGENPERRFMAGLDVTTKTESKKVKKGATLVAYRDRPDSKSTKGLTLYRVAVIHAKDAKRNEKPLDAMPAPMDIKGYLEEHAEEHAQQEADHDAAVLAYKRERQLRLAAHELEWISYDPHHDLGEHWHARACPPMTKEESFGRHMARVESKLAALAALQAQLEASELLIKAARSAKTLKAIREVLA